MVCGEQLVHSPYMQCLASLAVGLQLDALLCHPPVPPHVAHCPPEPSTISSPSPSSWASSEWAWLHCFSTTVKTAEALARGHTFPESFIVPDLEPVATDKLALLMVRLVYMDHTIILYVNIKHKKIKSKKLMFCWLLYRTTVNGCLGWMSRSCLGPLPDQKWELI